MPSAQSVPQASAACVSCRRVAAAASGSATARRSFDELGKVDVLPLRPGVLQGLGGGGQRLFVLPASVVERRTRPESARQRAVEAQGVCACDLVVDQQGGAIVSPEGGQVRHIRREDGERAPRRRQDLLRLGERRFGPVEVAFVDEQVRKGVERHWEHGQCAELTCGRDVCERELAKIHMVPQEVRRGGLEPREVKLLGFERVAPTGRQRLSQCRHGRRVPVDLESLRSPTTSQSIAVGSGGIGHSSAASVMSRVSAPVPEPPTNAAEVIAWRYAKPASPGARRARPRAARKYSSGAARESPPQPA